MTCWQPIRWRRIDNKIKVPRSLPRPGRGCGPVAKVLARDLEHSEIISPRPTPLTKLPERTPLPAAAPRPPTFRPGPAG